MRMGKRMGGELLWKVMCVQASVTSLKYVEMTKTSFVAGEDQMIELDRKTL